MRSTEPFVDSASPAAPDPVPLETDFVEDGQTSEAGAGWVCQATNAVTSSDENRCPFFALPNAGVGGQQVVGQGAQLGLNSRNPFGHAV